ncbi:MAG: type II secretion system protein [Deltaproteobacteria bacterium]|nr:type II secretion system protein [Deltaproteobacteria bacterium]MBW2418813.1 type II secretion system protein [Deltaproteobacteria bacterium]
MQRSGRAGAGFTMIELMIVIAIVGMLAAVAIPNYLRFQMKAKSSEAKVNLAAIHTAEESYFSEFGTYLPATAEPPAIPGTTRTVFDIANPGFLTLGWQPEGTVFFSYGVAVSGDNTAYTADAGADIDGNSTPQYWGVAKLDAGGSPVAAEVGCPVATLRPSQVGPCTPQAGQSVF